MTIPASSERRLSIGMVGLGMIFDETYRPVFERLAKTPLYDPAYGPVYVDLKAVATRTGQRVEHYRKSAPQGCAELKSYYGANAVEEMLRLPLHAICVATPDDRHFSPALLTLSEGRHLLVEKPAVLSLQQLDQLTSTATRNGVLAKIVYHKLLDTDHKRLRTLVQDGVLRHVNHGYCSLLEPRSVGQGQFAEWVKGRNPATYVAVHYFKLIDFSLFPSTTPSLKSIVVQGQRGQFNKLQADTWDSVQTRLTYRHDDAREAAFDIHTSWVNPDNFPGYVEQEVQFRFDNGVWNASQRKRGVEVVLEGCDGVSFKSTPNHYYNALVEEPWGERRQRGYGLEALERFFHEVAMVEYGGPPFEREHRLGQVRSLAYNELAADRRVIAAVQAQEALLEFATRHEQMAWAEVNGKHGGLVLWETGRTEPHILYLPSV